MASQKREKEETELKVPICTLAVSSSSQTIPTPNLSPIIRSADPRTSSGNPPETTDEEKRRCLKKRGRDRCSGSGCRKRIGLMGFRCRCGDMFCSEHRYSDRHYCSYDYKAAGRELIARENPVVRAAKLVKV